MTTCPSDDTLRQLLIGELDAARQAFEGHLQACATCQAAVKRLAPIAVPLPVELATTVTLPTAVPCAEKTTVGGPALAAPSQGGGTPRGYELLRELGRGGMGVVYLARQVKACREVAMKMIRADKLAGAAERERFRTEAKAAAQLYHPNIVQVHDVGDHEGCLYLALQYVNGGSLGQKLNGKPWPPRQAALLVHSLAKAMHYAHQCGVIHRDLKPGNILLPLDQAGRVKWEPLVADFGLAKQIGADSDQTQDGQIMGTPSYMPPEQAAGKSKAVGTAADVYSLGAILYELLTGRPPFKGKTVLETLEQVRTREPDAPRRLNGKVTRDLDTICLKCLRKEPAARYGSAEELADDLYCFLNDKPIAARPVGRLERTVKWVRREPKVAALLGGIAAAGMLLIVVLAVAVVVVSYKNHQLDTANNAVTEQRNRAESEKDRAVRASQQVRQLNASLFEADDALRHLPGGTQLRVDLVQQAQAEIDQLRREFGDDPAVLHALVEAYCRLGDVQGNPHHPNLNDHDGALASYRNAVEMAEHWAHNYPRDAKARRGLMIANNKVGEMLLENGNTREALTHFRAALQSLDEEDHLAGGELGNREQVRQRKHDRAVSHARVGDAQLLLGQTEDALVQFTKACALQRELAEAAPNDDSARRDLAVNLQRVGELQAARGDTLAAARSYDEAHQIFDALGKDRPLDPGAQRDLMVSYNQLGDLCARKFQRDAALTNYGKGAKIAADLYNRDKSNVLAVRDLALSGERIAGILFDQGRYEKALDIFTQSRDYRQKVVQKNPIALYRRELAVDWEKVGDVQLQLNQPLDARASYEESLKIRIRLHDDDPDNAEDRLNLSIAYNKLGHYFLTLKQPRDAIDSFKNALKIRQRLADDDTGNAEYKRRLALSWQNVGDAERDLGQNQDALKSYQTSLRLAKELEKKDSSNAENLHVLFVSQERLAHLYWDLGKRMEAMEAGREHLQIAKLLRQADPNNPQTEKDLKKSEALQEKLAAEPKN